MDDKEDHDDSINYGTDDNLFVKLKCKAFLKKPYDFKLTMKEFFEEMNIEEPLFKLSHDQLMFIKVKSQDDKDRLLQLSKEKKDQWVLYKTPVTATGVWESFDCSRMTRTFTGGKEEALDIILPLRKVPYETQLKNKVEVLRGYVTQADEITKQLLVSEKLIGKQYFPSLPTFEEPIKSPRETGYVTEYVKIDLEYDSMKKTVQAGMKVAIGRNRQTYYFLPIKDCIHIAPPIVDVVEHFIDYLNSNMEELKEFGNIHEEAKTGFVNKLQCTAGDKGEVLLNVVLSYFSNNEEFVPLEETDKPISLKQMLETYRSQQNWDSVPGEKMEVDPQDESTPAIPDKPKKPDWSSESGNPKGYKFVAHDFEDCHPSFAYFDFALADSHLDIAVPFLRKFYEDNKNKIGLHGIYVSWFNTSKRPVEWNRPIRVSHHVCGEIRVSKSVDGFPIHKFPFSSSFGPIIPNYGILLEQLVKLVEPKKNVDLAIVCENRSVFIFFAKKCRNIIALNDTFGANWNVAKNTKTRITFTGHNLSQIEFAYRKFGAPPASLIIWGAAKLRNAVIKKFIDFGVKKVVFVVEKIKVTTGSVDLTVTNPITSEIARINKLVYPYLSLKRMLPIDCNAGGELLSFIALYEENKDAPPLPPVVLHKLDPKLESKLPPTAIPPTHPKRAAKSDDEPDAKRGKYDFDGKNVPENRGGRGQDKGRGRDGGRGRGRGQGSVRGRGREERGRGTATTADDPDKAELLKQIAELKAQQEQLRKLIPGGNARFSSNSSSREWNERGGPRQGGSRSAWPDDSRRAQGAGRGDRYVSRDRYDSRDRSQALPRESSRYDSPRDLYGGSDVNRYGGSDGSRYGGSDGNRYGGSDGSRYGGSDGDRYGYGGGASRTVDSEKYVGSGYDYRNYVSSSDTYSSRYDPGNSVYERRDSSVGRAQSGSGPSGYRSAYEDINTESAPPPPPPPPVISKR